MIDPDASTHAPTNTPQVPAPEPASPTWLRAFIAIAPPPEVIGEVADLIERLRKGLNFTSCRPAWIPAESVHMTLLFLGRLERDHVEEAAEQLRLTAQNYGPLILRFRELGVFPHWSDPRVLWLGVKDKSRQLKFLQAELARRLAHLAFRPDGQAFHPHITLARFKSLRGSGPARNIIESHGRFEAGPFSAGSMTLYRSDLNAEGARHTPLHTAHFLPEKPIHERPPEVPQAD